MGNMNGKAKIAIDSDRIAELCRKNGIRKLAIFGSVLRDDFREDSDIDVLVDFEPGRFIGFRIFDIESELSALLGGRRVDVVSVKYLNPRLKERILSSAVTFYAQG